MATKKPATKKKTTAKKAAPRKKTTKKSNLQTFQVARPSTPFLTFAITRQTLYWTIIAAAVLGLGLWVIHLQNKVNSIYDQIERTQTSATIRDQRVQQQRNKELQQR